MAAVRLLGPGAASYLFPVTLVGCLPGPLLVLGGPGKHQLGGSEHLQLLQSFVSRLNLQRPGSGHVTVVMASHLRTEACANKGK